MIIRISDGNGNEIVVNGRTINHFINNNLVLASSAEVKVEKEKKEEVIVELAPYTFGEVFDSTFK